jgi:AraC-like DNA-binding protein
MAPGDNGAGMVPVQRTELATRDMDVIADQIRREYVEHRARFRCLDPARAQAADKSAIAGPLHAGVLRWTGVEYRVRDAILDGFPLALRVLHGSGVLTSMREELYFTEGDVFLAPPHDPYGALMGDCELLLVQLPWAEVAALAEQRTGLPAAELRFEWSAPVSDAAGAAWAGIAGLAFRLLVESGRTEFDPLLARELTGLAAGALLETFPSTAMSAHYVRGPGWVPPAAVATAAAFLEAHPDQPVTTALVAAAAGVPPQALDYAFARTFGTSPARYLRRIRLERAHEELAGADPAGPVTVAAVARRWGWVSLAQFALAYRLRFGVPPDRTLHQR